MTDELMSWAEWHALVIADLRDAIGNEVIHPAGRVTCYAWLNELIEAAEQNKHHECTRLETLIRDKIARESHDDLEHVERSGDQDGA